MNKLPLVSIIIPVYNGANYMRDAIDSALAQTYPNIEIIVVNDGSTDNGKTDKIAKSYGDKIRYIHKKNGGVSSAINCGIENMSGEYFSWLSHDDMYLPDKIEKEIQAIQSQPNAKIVFSNFQLFDEKGKVFAETHFEKQATQKAINANIFPVIRGMVNGDTVLIHKSVFQQCGTFDETVSTSADYILWLKIFKQFEHIFIPEALSKYRIHPEQDTQKHPEYNKESDIFWSTAIKSITENQTKTWGYSLLQIYTDLYRQFQNDNLVESAKIAYELCLSRKDKDAPLISVLIPSYNSEKYLSSAINSLLDSDFGNFEAIIIDDGSSDNTLSIANSFAKKDFRIQIVQNNHNLGVAAALNAGLKHAKGKYFARLDSDDTIQPQKLLRQFLYLEKSPHKFCSTNINFIDEDNNTIKMSCYEDLKAPIRFTAAFTNPIPNSSIMYSLDIIRKNKLKFKKIAVAEDYGFLLDYLKHGDGFFIDEGLYNYRLRKDSLYHSNKQTAMEQSKKLCEGYTKTFLNNFSKTRSFTILNFFDNYQGELSELDFYHIIEESEGLIQSFAKQYGFTKSQKISCKAFLLIQLHRKLLAQQNIPATEYSMKTPVRMTYHYFKQNGFKKTIYKIIFKITGKKNK